MKKSVLIILIIFNLSFLAKAQDFPFGAWKQEELDMSKYNNDVSAHAEMQALTAAANYMGGKYLKNCTLYVTLEPCVMCAGASYWFQLSKIVFGAYDTQRGFGRISQKIIHPKTVVTGGIFENECAELVRNFFKKKR